MTRLVRLGRTGLHRGGLHPPAWADDRGGAVVELALVVPVLAFVAAAVLPVFGVVTDHAEAARAAAHGARVAAYTPANPSPGPCGPTTRRASAEEVTAAVLDAGELVTDASAVTVALDGGGTLCAATPGEAVTVSIRVDRPLPPLGGAANRLAALVGAGPVLPDPYTVTAESSALID